MKKLSVMLLALAGLFIFTGCSDSPKDVVVKWTEAIVNGDIKKANEYSTENTHALNGMIIGIVNGKSEDAKKTKAELEASIEKLKNAKEEIDGDTAKVFMEDDKDKPAVLKKVDGKWKVDAQKK